MTAAFRSDRYPRRLVFAATASITVGAFLADQLLWLSDKGWDVHVVSSDGPELDRLKRDPRVKVHVLSMQRRVAPLRDIGALLVWIRLLRRVRPWAVIAGTPKAGLLGTTAAWLTRTPVRIYLLRGLRAEGLDGAARAMAFAVERLTAKLATTVIAVSTSLRAAAISHRLIAADRVVVLGAGSSNGVDVNRFTPRSELSRMHKRAELGIPAASFVVGFVGRLTPDKGIPDLVAACEVARERLGNLYLLVVGGLDVVEPLTKETCDSLVRSWIVMTGAVEDPAEFYSAMDIFAFPSHREGFPNAPLEAAASSLPVLTSSATGCADAVVDGRTGAVLKSWDPTLWGDEIVQFAREPDRRHRYGKAGRDWAATQYANSVVWSHLDAFLKLQYRQAIR